MKKKIIFFSFLVLLLSNDLFGKKHKAKITAVKQEQIIQAPIQAPEIKEEKSFSKVKKNTQLTMDQAVQMAYEYKPALKAMKFAVNASRTDEKKALSGYFPQISIQDTMYTSGGRVGEISGGIATVGGRRIDNNFSLQINQLVYSFAGPLENRKIAQKSTDAAQYSEEQQKDYVRYNVEAAFLQSFLLQRKNELIKSLNISSVETLKKAENQKKQDLLGKNDWLKDAANYAQNQSTVFYYSDELNTAQGQLEYLIGKPFNSNDENIMLEWNSNKEISLKDLEYYYEKALANRKELKSKQKEIEIQNDYQSFYKKTYLPTFNLAGTVDRNAGNPSSNVGITLNWSLSDGGANYHESNKANANKLKAIMEKDELTQQIRYEVQKAYNDLSTLLKQLAAKNIQLTQAQNEFSLNELQHNVGLMSQVDFESSKLNWETQKFDWLSLKITAAVKERELIYTCGYPKDFWGI